jgi:hypothetical protein
MLRDTVRRAVESVCGPARLVEVRETDRPRRFVFEVELDGRARRVTSWWTQAGVEIVVSTDGDERMAVVRLDAETAAA